MPLVQRSSLGVSSSRTIRSPRNIRKSVPSPVTKDKILQLWVEHGTRISARSAVLISSTINAHNAAVSARSVVSIEQFSPLPSTYSPTFGVVSASPSVLLKRRQVRDLRRRHVVELESRERAETKARELEEAQQREQHERNERERILRRRAAEQRDAEARSLRHREEKGMSERGLRENTKKGKVDSSVAHAEITRDNLKVGSNLTSKNMSETKPFSKTNDAGITDQKNSADVNELKRENKNVSTVKRDSNALQVPIIARGNDMSVGRNDKILDGVGMPEDIIRIAQVWNKLCDEAEPFRRDPSMKKPRLEVKKQINLMVNQIAASVKQVSIKVNNLCQVLRNALAGGGAGGEAFAMKEIAQRLVSEADGSVALSRTAAFAVGSVIVGVAAGARDPSKMRDVFLGAFYNHCVYTIPAYGVRDKNETIEEYKLRIGYKDSETPESYMERSCGCVSLFAAVMQTEQVLGPAKSHVDVCNPFSLELGWTWLARIANREQRAITPAITYAFLETAGYRMSKTYRRQFAKLMAALQQIVVLKAVRTAPKGPTSRMDTLIDEFVASGCVVPKPPEGSVLPVKDMEFL